MSDHDGKNGVEGFHIVQAYGRDRRQRRRLYYTVPNYRANVINDAELNRVPKPWPRRDRLVSASNRGDHPFGAEPGEKRERQERADARHPDRRAVPPRPLPFEWPLSKPHRLEGLYHTAERNRIWGPIASGRGLRAPS